MKQREVTDTENTCWTCVQAFSIAEEKEPAKAAELATNDNGDVTVVCTPSGGAKTVRLELPATWEDMPDEALAAAINQAKQ